MSILTAIGIIGALWFLLPLFTGRKVLNIGNVTGVLISVMLMAAGIRPSLLDTSLAKAVMIFLAMCLVPAVYFTAGMLSACRKKPDGSETLIILGCEIIGEHPSLMQVERLEAGLKYLQANKNAYVICAGGQGDNEIMSEAQAMYTWLKNRGIGEQRMIMEDQSRTTSENIRNSKQLMEERGLPLRAAVCSNEFHLLRASLICREEGISFAAVPAATAWWLLPTFYVRELYALTYFLITGKRKGS